MPAADWKLTKSLGRLMAICMGFSWVNIVKICDIQFYYSKFAITNNRRVSINTGFMSCLGKWLLS
jgi:hypothetical protein